MQQFYKTTLSLFFLFLFAFPQIEKGIHDFEHASDPHCRVVGKVHFHKQEHSCSICDYTIGISHSPGITNYDIFLTTHSTSYQLYAAQVILSEPDYQLPLRAPPIV